MCIKCFVSRPDVEAGFLGDDFQHAFPAAVGSIWDGVVRIVFGNILGTRALISNPPHIVVMIGNENSRIQDLMAVDRVKIHSLIPALLANDSQ